MTIQKKSLISTLKTAKKANVASAPLAHVEAGATEVRTRKMYAKHNAKAMAKHMAKAFSKRTAKAFGKKTAKVFAKRAARMN